MWAAFKSDLKEFASGAANETNAVASKVVETTVNILGEGGGDAEAADGDDRGRRASSSSSSSQAQGDGGIRHDGSVLLANAAYSIGAKGLQGLSSVSSMVGGIVAPRVNADDTTYSKGKGKSYYAATSSSSSSFSNTSMQKNTSTTTNPSSALSSMLAEDEDEEEELGWDDDEEDDELNVEEEEDRYDDDDIANVIVKEGGSGATLMDKASSSNDDDHGPKNNGLFDAAGDSNTQPLALTRRPFDAVRICNVSIVVRLRNWWNCVPSLQRWNNNIRQVVV